MRYSTIKNVCVMHRSSNSSCSWQQQNSSGSYNLLRWFPNNNSYWGCSHQAMEFREWETCTILHTLDWPTFSNVCLVLSIVYCTKSKSLKFISFNISKHLYQMMVGYGFYSSACSYIQKTFHLEDPSLVVIQTHTSHNTSTKNLWRYMLLLWFTAWHTTSIADGLDIIYNWCCHCTWNIE